MAYSASITKFAQSVYLAVKNRYFDDIGEADGQVYIDQVVDWTNQFLDELENTVDGLGNPVYWNWLRSMGYTLGTAVTGQSIYILPDAVINLVAAYERPVLITVAGKVVSSWAVVSPNQMRSNTWANQVTKVGQNLIFSKPLTAQENGGIITGDITTTIPRLDASTETALTLVKPKQLLILGVAKNSSLPDIVQGGLSPSFVQKYNDLLQSAIISNNASADADVAQRDDNAYIGGIW